MSPSSFSRRQVLKGCLGGLVGGAFSGGGLAQDDPPAANDRIQVAVIGVGHRGQTNLHHLLRRPDIQVVAVCDVDQSHRQRAKRLIDQTYSTTDTKAYEAFGDLIADELIDAAVLAVPDHWHALIAIACAEAGIDLYGEPPLAHSVVGGRAVCHAVTRFGRVWQTGSWRRSDPFFQRACEFVAAGRIGSPQRVEVGTLGGIEDYSGGVSRGFYEEARGLNYDLWLGPAPWLPYHPGRLHQNWRWHRNFGGGQLMAWIGHYADIALWALGLDQSGPLKVEATGEFADHTIFNVPTRYDIDTYFFNDLTLRISSSLAPGVRWIGDDGWIYVTEKQLLASSDDLLRPDEGDFTNRFIRNGNNHWDNFFEAVRTRGRTVSPCESAQRAATLGHLGMISLLAGRPLAWKPDQEAIFEDHNAAELLERPCRAPWMLTD